MRKIFKINESQLRKVIKNLVIENDVNQTDTEGEELENQIETINSELSNEDKNLSNLISVQSVCEFGGKDPVEEFISKQKFESEEQKNLVRDFLNELKGSGIRQLISKIRELKLYAKKNKSVQEDLQKLSSNPTVLIALIPLLIMGIIFMIKFGLFRPNYCRRWLQQKKRMVGY